MLPMSSLPCMVLVDPRTGAFSTDRTLGDAVGNVVDRIIAGHVLLLQEEGGVDSRSAKMATSTLAPVTSSRPDDCTWMTARWMTRWKPAVGLASRPRSVIRLASSVSM
jgi:hypothetical protein